MRHVEEGYNYKEKLYKYTFVASCFLTYSRVVCLRSLSSGRSKPSDCVDHSASSKASQLLTLQLLSGRGWATILKKREEAYDPETIATYAAPFISEKLTQANDPVMPAECAEL